MVQKTEMLNETRKIARSLVEGIIDEALHSVMERKDSRYASVGSLSLELLENEYILNSCSLRTESVEKPKQLENLSHNTSLLTDCQCPNRQDVGMLSSVQSTIYKQGDGDYQPKIQESMAFYRLGRENNECCQGKCQHYFSVSSLNTEISTNELIAEMQSEIHNFSFDHIQLSDTEDEDKLQDGFDHISNDILIEENESFNSYQTQYNTQPEVIQTSKDSFQHENSENLFTSKQSSQHRYNRELIQCCDDTLGKAVRNDLDQTTCTNVEKSSLHRNIPPHLRKFYKLQDNHYLPLNHELTHDCLQSVGFGLCNQSQLEEKVELITIDKEHEINPSLINCNMNPDISTLAISINTTSTIHDNPEKLEKDFNTNIRAVETECTGKMSREDVLEVQVNVIEPVKCLESNNEEENDPIQTRKYWSNIGLMTHHDIDPTYLGPSPVPGIESIKNMTRIREKSFGHSFDEEIQIANSQGFEDNSFKTSFDLGTRTGSKNLFTTRTNDEKRKKKKLFSRFTTAIQDIFKSKKNSSLNS